MTRSIPLHAWLIASGLLLAAHGCGSEPAQSQTPTSSAPAAAGADAKPSGEAPSASGSPAESGETGGSSPSPAAGSAAAGGGSGGSSSPAAAAASGGSGAAATSAGMATFSAIYTEILTKGATGNCMFAACHGGPPDPAVNGGLQIKAGDKAGAYKNLVDAKSPGAVCSGKTYVIPGDSAGSLLVQKLADAPPCGAKMPIGSPLTAAQVAQIAKWIDEGAQDN